MTISEAVVVSENVCLMIVSGPVPLGQRKSHLAVDPSRWVRCGLAGAEDVTAIAHVMVRHEQLTGEGLEVT